MKCNTLIIWLGMFLRVFFSLKHFFTLICHNGEDGACSWSHFTEVALKQTFTGISKPNLLVAVHRLRLWRKCYPIVNIQKPSNSVANFLKELFHLHSKWLITTESPDMQRRAESLRGTGVQMCWGQLWGHAAVISLTCQEKSHVARSSCHIPAFHSFRHLS